MTVNNPDEDFNGLHSESGEEQHVIRGLEWKSSSRRGREAPPQADPASRCDAVAEATARRSPPPLQTLWGLSGESFAGDEAPLLF